mmetsp:Transcript_20053/g.52077  ORF Transcript_20053/g.52077 Transcript_20053/m.52077 type:complete len:551 (-) Transcript_20053:266-1918(-)
MATATVTQMFHETPSVSSRKHGGSLIRPIKVNVVPAQTSSPSSGGASVGAADPSGPITPQVALKRFGRVLTDYEKKEIMEYPNIYFVGPTATKIRAPAKDTPDASARAANYGYDNSKARYRVVKHDHIGYRFEVLGALGNGSFGDVVRAYDHKKRRHVALKIIRNEKRFHDQGAIEVKLLEHLKAKDKNNKHNVIHMFEHFVFRSHLCISFEMLAHDLYSELKKGGFKGLGVERVRESAADLVQCLRNLRRSRIVHCDLKPENVLIKAPGKSGLKVIDFGSSCFAAERVHTYIQSRFYRAPEIVLGGEYGTPIDMWSLGCILVELLTGKPLFPAASEKELIAMQVEMLGMPEKEVVVAGSRSHHYFTANFKLRPVVDRKGRARGTVPRPLPAVLLTDDNKMLRDFVLQCLQWDPAKRISPRDASRHPFITGFAVEPAPVSPATTPPSTARRASAPHAISLKSTTFAQSRIKRGNSDTAAAGLGSDGADFGRTPMRHQSQIFKMPRRSLSAHKGSARAGSTSSNPGESMAQYHSMPLDVGRSLKVIFDQYS